MLGGPVKKDLRAFPPRFEILPLIATAMNGIRDVHKACAVMAASAPSQSVQWREMITSVVCGQP
jgi:hypothetical protein